jgi:hypothetical protein
MPKRDRHRGIFGIFDPILDRIGEMVGRANMAQPVLHGQPYGAAQLATDQDLARQQLQQLEGAIERRERLGFAFAYPPYNSPLGDPSRWERDVRKVLGRVREEARALLKCVLEHPPFPAEGDDNARRRYLQAAGQFQRLAGLLRGKRMGRLQELASQLQQRPQTLATSQPPPPLPKQPPARTVGIDTEDEEILKALEQNKPRLLTYVMIEGHSTVSRKTTGKRVPSLVNQGYVSRPKGPKSGVTITAAGEELLRTLRVP